MFSANLLVKWYVQYTRNGITFFLAEEDDTKCKRVWTQRKDKALKYHNQSDAEQCVVYIKNKFQNKKMDIKVV